MEDKNINKKVGIYIITEIEKEKAKDGHKLYRAKCLYCGKEVTHKRLSDLVKRKHCTHIDITGNFCVRYEWESKRLHKIYNEIKKRCYNKNCKDYKYYGSKGVSMCDKWLLNPKAFETWALNNGYKETLTIDRIDSQGNYNEENCRWITREENCRRAGKVNWITIGNTTKTGREWASYLDIGINQINKKIRKYGIEETIQYIKKLQNKKGI